MLVVLEMPQRITVSSDKNDDTIIDIRHTQCGAVKNIVRKINAFHQNEPYYRAYVKRYVKWNTYKKNSRIVKRKSFLEELETASSCGLEKGSC